MSFRGRNFFQIKESVINFCNGKSSGFNVASERRAGFASDYFDQECCFLNTNMLFLKAFFVLKRFELCS